MAKITVFLKHGSQGVRGLPPQFRHQKKD